MDQNDRISNNTSGQEKNDALILHLDTLGLVNGCVDSVAQQRSYPEMLYNNTYGLSIFNKTSYDQVIRDIDRPDTGCLALITKCQSLADKLDSGGYGNNEKVNAACRKADEYCATRVEELYYDGGDFDIAAPRFNPYPPSFHFGFLARQWVQAALGVPLNYTGYSDVAYKAFIQTGDLVRGGRLADIGNLLDRGVKVAMIYGDRDHSCNCKWSSYLQPFGPSSAPMVMSKFQGWVEKTSRLRSTTGKKPVSGQPATRTSRLTAATLAVRSANTGTIHFRASTKPAAKFLLPTRNRLPDLPADHLRPRRRHGQIRHGIPTHLSHQGLAHNFPSQKRGAGQARRNMPHPESSLLLQ